MNQSPLRQRELAVWAPALPVAGWSVKATFALLSALLLGGACPAFAQIQRALGLDISAWQGNISQTTWNNIRTNENRQFVILRSSRGGTTGYYNQNDSDNSDGLNTLSQRYDDPYFIQNVNRATTAGMFVGSYHFSRPEIIASTQNSGGIANTGTDEANHFIQMAGPWMRPGYLMPVHDLESGDGLRTDDEMAQFCIDFSSRIYAALGIRPAIYVNGNYAAFILGTASLSLRNQLVQLPANRPSPVSPAYPTLWSARWPNQANPNAIDVQNSEPKDSYAAIYGPWDDAGVTHPWTFWQYASTGRLQSFNNGGSNLDLDVARGGVEFLKDYLVPAVWMNDSDGQWTTLANWNSGLTPVAPVQGPGQVARVGTLTLPVARLPGAAGTGVTSGQHDTVILERPNTSITVSLSSGTHNIRKLYVRETLNITGGSLNINYVPSADSTTNGAQFSGPVTLSGSGSLSVHTLQVDATRTFTLGTGSTLTFNTIRLMPHATTPAKIVMNGDVTFNSLSNTTARIVKGGGWGNSGLIEMGSSIYAFHVSDGSADVDLSIDVPIATGGLAKVGLGTMSFNAANTYSSGTILVSGRLLVNNLAGSGTGTGEVSVIGGTLGGTGTITGAVTVNSGGTIAPGASIGTLTLNSAPIFNGTNFMEINRNGGFPLADKLVLTSGTLNYGGALVVSNMGAALAGGEVFTLFAAPAYSGAFAATILPTLNAGLNWFPGGLTTDGTIKVNRRPVTSPLTFTNVAPSVLQIPFATLTSNSTDADGNTITVSSVNLTTTNGITLTTNAGSLTYSNLASVTDQISYTITDGHGGSTTGIVNVVNIGSSPSAQFTNSPSANATSATLHFVGTPGWPYYLERSTNLVDWATISTNVAPPSGLVEHTDNFQDLAEPASAAFYRLRWAP